MEVKGSLSGASRLGRGNYPWVAELVDALHDELVVDLLTK